MVIEICIKTRGANSNHGTGIVNYTMHVKLTSGQGPVKIVPGSQEGRGTPGCTQTHIFLIARLKLRILAAPGSHSAHVAFCSRGASAGRPCGAEKIATRVLWPLGAPSRGLPKCAA